ILEFAGETVFSVDDLHRLLTAEIAGPDVPVVGMRRARIETLTVRPDVDG
ncbi:MAG: hypothetical protein JWR47_3623, partial [Phenylobacterium sp.]|nr:hypothetical protein [Phenylobacterium sp.]